jgi:hypothetical protein
LLFEFPTICSMYTSRNTQIGSATRRVIKRHTQGELPTHSCVSPFQCVNLYTSRCVQPMSHDVIDHQMVTTSVATGSALSRKSSSRAVARGWLSHNFGSPGFQRLGFLKWAAPGRPEPLEPSINTRETYWTFCQSNVLFGLAFICNLEDGCWLMSHTCSSFQLGSDCP